MKGDFSRRTYDPRKHYSAVLHEQGRVLTDADFDEEHRILSGAHETAVADLVGGCGAPMGDAGFAVSSPDGVGLTLSPGRFYADGALVVNDAAAPVPYDAQPDRVTGAGFWPPAAGSYAVYLDVWRRLVTALDDASIREVALGGPTTSARERVVWQARHVAVPEDWTCQDGLPLPERTTGRMAAQASPESVVTTPCLVPPLAGYMGLENQFYRVEVFTSGDALDVTTAPAMPVAAFPAGTVDQVELSAADAASLAVGDVVELIATGAGSDPLEATFAQVAAVNGAVVTLTGRVPQFGPNDAPALLAATASVVVSRENGSVVTTLGRIDGQELTVGDLGPDDVLGFAPGQWVEIADDAVELEGLPRQLRQVDAVDTDRLVLTLRTSADPLAALPNGVDPVRHPTVRRWDAACGVVLTPDGSGWIHLENGIQIRFTAGRYVSGDYWQFPARTAIVDPASGTIEWPQDADAPAALPPAGVIHHACPLALIRVVDNEGPVTSVDDDCRDLFPPVTSLTSLFYVGGDGQEARRGDANFPSLPSALSVRVASGSVPVAGARVGFTVTQGAGQVAPAVAVTDSQGRVDAAWTLDPNTPTQTCEAHLLDHAGAPVAHQVVTFHATVQEAQGEGHGCCTCIGPGGDFPTIEVAVRELLSRGERDLCLCLLPGDHLVEALEVQADAKERPFHLTVHGCGRGSRVLTIGGWQLRGWRSLHLKDFDLLFARDMGLLTETVDEVLLDGLHVRGILAEDALVRVHDAESVLVTSCLLSPWTELDLRRLAELLSSLPPLDKPWQAPPERLVDTVNEVAAALRETSPDVRHDLAAGLRRLAGDGRRRLPSGLADQLVGLADLLDRESPDADLAGALLRLPSGIGALAPSVALEIGARDEVQERIADRSLVRAARVLVLRNEIQGDVSLYGRRSPEPLTPAEREALGGWAKGGGLGTGMAGTVHVRENRFQRLLVSVGMVKAMREVGLQGQGPLVTVYEVLQVTDNVIDGQGGQLLARHVALGGNEFTLDGVARPTAPLIVTDLVADTAVISTNHGRLVPDAAGGATPILVDQVTRTFVEGLDLELKVV